MLIFFSHLHLGLPNGLFPSVFPTKYPVYASPLPHTRRERCRPQMTTWRIRISCWIPKATETHSEYIIFIAFALQRWLRERTSLLRYTYIACLVGTVHSCELIVECVCYHCGLLLYFCVEYIVCMAAFILVNMSLRVT